MSASAPEIVPESGNHAAAIERVLDRAFGPGRHAKTSERVRENGAVFAPDLSRVALSQGAPIGCCRIWRIGVGAREALFLGPLAVDPARQHAGLGAELVRASLEACRATPFDAVVLIGAPEFFAPLGFVGAPPGALTLPGPVDPRRLLVCALKPGAEQALRGAITAPRGSIPRAAE